jgi:hypothetical protein
MEIHMKTYRLIALLAAMCITAGAATVLTDDNLSSSLFPDRPIVVIDAQAR